MLSDPQFAAGSFSSIELKVAMARKAIATFRINKEQGFQRGEEVLFPTEVAVWIAVQKRLWSHNKGRVLGLYVSSCVSQAS